MVFDKNARQKVKSSQIRRVIKGIKAKHLTTVLMFVHFSKALCIAENWTKLFLPEEIASVTMMLYQNSKSMVRSPTVILTFWYSSRSLAGRYVSTLPVHTVLGQRPKNFSRPHRTRFHLHKISQLSILGGIHHAWITLAISLCYQIPSTKLQSSSIFR